MTQYLDLIAKVIKEGVEKKDRIGTGTRSIFGYQMRFNLKVGFPLMATKKLYVRSIFYELLRFLTGETNIKFLKENNVSIWNEWADKNGDLDSVYSYQWRSWPTYDGKHIGQISQLINSLSNNSDSRRHILNSWNVAMIDQSLLQLSRDPKKMPKLNIRRNISSFFDF